MSRIAGMGEVRIGTFGLVSLLRAGLIYLFRGGSGRGAALGSLGLYNSWCNLSFV